MEEGKANDKILSYNDVVLRRSDLAILSGPFYLNDRIIEFYFSYLSTSIQSNNVLLVPPSIAFFIKECPDEATLKDFLQPLNLSRKHLIIFPINDNDDVAVAEGGSHWSLLAFERNANLFVHHDSNGGFNNTHSRKVYRAVVSYTAPDAKLIDWSDTPRQMNGYDCGLYVTAIARGICEWYASDGKKDLWFDKIMEQVTPSAVCKMRREIFELVENLMAKK